MAMIKAFAILAIGALVERALCVPQGAVITPAPIVFGSTAALPNLIGAATQAQDDPNCDVCYVIADVAAVVWYSEVFLNPVATQVVSIGVGNGTRATRTSVIRNEASFTFDPDRMASAFEADVAITPVPYSSTVNLGGAILTSPTAYNVFSAYSITSALRSGGSCVTSSGSRVVLPTPYSETLASASGRVTLDAAGEQAFINYLGFTSCLPGGERAVANTALVPVANITQKTTVTGSSVSLAGQVLNLAPTTNPTITNAPIGLVTLTRVMESTTVTAVLTGTAFPAASATAPVIVAGSTTLTATGGDISLAAFEPSIISALFGNATASAPSGTLIGTGVGNYSVVPFISGAERIGDLSTVMWGTALAAVVFAVGLL